MMRAERLITLLLLLQRRREVTARQLADELGVSPRTIYRDVEALCEIGIPVYADRGAAGGFRLVEGYHADALSGLTRAERNALTMLDLPEPLGELEVGQQLKRALLKLYAVIAPGQQRVLLDWSGEEDAHAPTPDLQRLYVAIEQDRKVRLRYRLWGQIDIEVEAAPCGLVLRASAWRLVYLIEGQLRDIATHELLGVEVMTEGFARPAGFDLKACWATLRAANQQAARPTYETILLALPQVSEGSLRLTGADVTEIEHDASGQRTLIVRFNHERHALRTLLGLGGAVEVLAPESLRLAVQDYAAQILQQYGHPAPAIHRP